MNVRRTTEDVTKRLIALTTRVALSVPARPVMKETDMLVQVITFSIMTSNKLVD